MHLTREETRILKGCYLFDPPYSTLTLFCKASCLLRLSREVKLWQQKLLILVGYFSLQNGNASFLHNSFNFIRATKKATALLNISVLLDTVCWWSAHCLCASALRLGLGLCVSVDDRLQRTFEHLVACRVDERIESRVDETDKRVQIQVRLFVVDDLLATNDNNYYGKNI